MKVKATRTGYIYHVRRREGDVFTLKPIEAMVREKDHTTGREKFVTKILTPEDQFSPNWMEKVEAKVPEKTSTSQQEIDRIHDELLAERASAKSIEPSGPDQGNRDVEVI